MKAFCRGPDRALQGAALCALQARLPMTVTGKPQKFLMREQMVKELGLVVSQDGLSGSGRDPCWIRSDSTLIGLVSGLSASLFGRCNTPRRDTGDLLKLRLKRECVRPTVRSVFTRNFDQHGIAELVSAVAVLHEGRRTCDPAPRRRRRPGGARNGFRRAGGRR